ncbi:23S rRNA (pseudouridine(1915)-N(3))-methyltransferase RlmH [Desulfonatronospira sp.]|uniref:23S rRNA (pseudouridine(1915)-N(3))-methyltransferase RlmH n=1 Tax=Desulfonatronospira sp. TaxID=1962951 RepID=UPI0025BB4DEA|nr:23S rRNA (pseudouridine(1915)-N(3))-methyltransferase RlmH [Desulfonatronospira sp.]
MRGIKILLVGRFQKGFFRKAFDFYLQRVRKVTQAEVVEVKEVRHRDPGLRMQKEGENILARVGPRDLLLVMDEKGTALGSGSMARELTKWEEDPGCVPCFVVGGAYGLSENVRSRADRLIGLGPMTLPHELAAVVLMEQIYRAQCISRGHPYHH